jgi:transposase
MLTLPPSIQVFLCLEPADMRKGIDGLSALTKNKLAADPLSGHLFCFFNKRSDKVKVLYWDRGGFCLFHKRLEKGRFHWEAFRNHKEPGASPLRFPELILLLEGIDLQNAKRHPRFALP